MSKRIGVLKKYNNMYLSNILGMNHECKNVLTVVGHGYILCSIGTILLV